MFLKFHAQCGDCGYTIKQSMALVAQALQDPYQLVIGARTATPTTGEEHWVGYIWCQVQDGIGYILQAWSCDREASKMLIPYAEEWLKQRGCFIIRAGVSRKWLRALEKKWGYVAKMTTVEKRLA